MKILNYFIIFLLFIGGSKQACTNCFWFGCSGSYCSICSPGFNYFNVAHSGCVVSCPGGKILLIVILIKGNISILISAKPA